MEGQNALNDTLILIAGTSAMLAMCIAIVVFALVFQRKLIRKERKYREVEKLLQKQELSSVYNILQAQDSERKRIASEIHDNLGSLLATLKIYSDLAITDQGRNQIHLAIKVNEITDALTGEVRKLSHELDTGILQNFGLRPAIEQLCEAIDHSGRLNVTSIVDLSQPIDREFALHFYRIVQELFTNTLKHAKATAVRFEITQVNTDVTIIYEDNGVGFDEKKILAEGMGINNIKSRVRKMGGEFKISSSPAGSVFIIDVHQN